MVKSPNHPIFLFLIAGLLSCCATTLAGKDPSTDVAKVKSKIGFAIGRETDAFNITSQQGSEAPGGSNRTDYSILTNDGVKYSCYILEPSGFGKFMSWGMATGSEAVCSSISSGGSTSTASQAKPNCNSLLHAAGKC